MHHIDAFVFSVYGIDMGTIQDANGVLSETEFKLRQLMECALKEQRYADVAAIAGLANGIAHLLQPRSLDHLQASVDTSVVSATGRVNVTDAMPMRSKKSDKREYPRFERDDDKLVKIGWSKKNRAAYEHRASRDAVMAFTRHLASKVTEGKVFAVEELLPVSDVANGGEIPAYQVYLTLAWLRDVGAVAKKGRDGYVLRRGGLANGALDTFWASLPARVG